VFFGLSAYALTTRKDFSFMGGFLMVGLIVAVVAMIANIFLAIPALSLTISAAVVMIMSGLILFDTSRIMNGGETNYIRATVGLYLNIYNLFIHILHLLTALSGRRLIRLDRLRKPRSDPGLFCLYSRAHALHPPRSYRTRCRRQRAPCPGICPSRTGRSGHEIACVFFFDAGVLTACALFQQPRRAVRAGPGMSFAVFNQGPQLLFIGDGVLAAAGRISNRRVASRCAR
jgi:hypothetical protein